MAKQALFLFGLPRVTIDGDAVDIRSRKGLALLSYLAVTRTPQSRDMLAGLLWPEYEQTRARANLRRTLFNLNRTPVADWLQSDSETLRLDDRVLADVDVIRFEERVAGGSTTELEEATWLYRDDFLAGYYLPDSEPFDEWGANQRARLQRMMLDALDELAQRHLERGAPEEALAAARRQLEIDNLRESAWRQLIAVLARSGARSEALAEYVRCRRVLHDELGIEPDAATEALIDAIRADGLPDFSEDVVSATHDVLVDDTPGEERGADNRFVIAASPYRGLFAFREDDAEFFFGREELTELLVHTVHAEPIVAVVGPSGSGKTSIVYAGLVAHLRWQEKWATASFRPGMEPFQALAAALVPLLVIDSGPVDQLVEARKLAEALRHDAVGLGEVVGQIRQQHGADRILLVADQFEEVFTLCQDDDLRQRFLDCLLELVFSQQYLPAPIFSLVLTLRADFVGQALSHRAFADAIQESDVKLGPMTRPELTRAIVKPAERQGARFEPGLVTRMLDDVGDEPGNLPLLEFALDTLWHQRQGIVLRHDTYDNIGRVEGALARYADDVYASLDEDDQQVARRVFTQLIQPGEGTEDTRRVATDQELGEEGWTLVSKLADARLVVTGTDADGQRTAEVVHEALIRSWDRLRAWMAEDRDFRLWQERLRGAERQWQENDRDEGSLLRGAALAAAEAWCADRAVEIGESERTFIEASVALRQRRQAAAEAEQRRIARLQRRLVYTLAIGMAAALALAAIAGVQWRSANQERQRVEAQSRVAFSRQLAAQSGSHLERSALDLAHLLAIEAVHLDQNPDSLAALRAAVEQPDRTIRRFEGHEDSVLQAVWSEDDVYIATTSDDETARIWDANTGEQLVVLEGHTGWLSLHAQPVWSPEGDRIATAGDDQTLRVWDAATGKNLMTLDVADVINWIEWSPDGTRILAIGGGGGKIRDAETGELLVTLDGHANFTQQGHWSRDGSRVITNSADQTARVWNAETGEQLMALTGHSDGVMRARWNPDETRIMTAGIDGDVRLWDAATGAELLAFAGHGDAILEAHWNRAGTRLLTASADRTAKIWDAATGALLTTMAGHEASIWDAVWSPDERLVATAGDDDGTARVWDAATGEELARFGHGDTVNHVRWRSDGRVLLTASNDGRATLWAVGLQPNVGLLPELRGSPSPYHTVEWSQDDRLLLVASDDPKGAAVIWDTHTGEVVHNLTDMDTWFARKAVWNQDESQALVSADDGRIRLWDADSGELRMTLVGHGEDVWRVGWNADETRILSAGEDGTARIWNAQTGDELTMYDGHDDEIWTALWHPDGRRVVTGGKHGLVHVWAGDSGETLLVLDRFAGGVDQSVWNAEGDRLLTVDESGAARVWNVDSGELVLEFADPDGKVVEASWSPDESTILTAGENAVRIWDAASGELLKTLTTDGNFVDASVWSADGAWIVLAVSNTGIHIWDVAGGKLLEQISDVRHVEQLQWSHDGRRLAVVGFQGVRQYLMDIDELIDIACNRVGRNLTAAEWTQYLGDLPHRNTCAMR